MRGELLSDRIRTAREEAGLTLRALARLSGVDRAWLRRLERGEISRGPSVEVVERVATACRVSPAWIAFGDCDEK
jgi:transcriptional regulator with XRE-family HTH domain